MKYILRLLLIVLTFFVSSLTYADVRMDNLDLLGETPAYNDEIPVSDVSASGASKNVTYLNLIDAPNVDSYGGLEDAITAIGATEMTVVVTTAQTLTGDLTTPTTLKIIVGIGGSIDGAHTLTVNGSFNAGLYQVFGSSITVEFGPIAIQEIYPEWWGEFPNGTDDTAVLNKAITAANVTRTYKAVDYGVGSFDPAIIIQSGNYYIDLADSNTISTHFIAPYATFRYVTAAGKNQSDHFFKFDTGDRGTCRGFRHIKIGRIIGDNVLTDVAHYGVGVAIIAGQQERIEIGDLQGLYMGISYDAKTEDVHMGSGNIDIQMILGCDYGIYQSSGATADPGSRAEANKYHINYIAYCDTAVYFRGDAGYSYNFSNLVEIDVLEIHNRADQIGFQLYGSTVVGNKFYVITNATVPSGTGRFVKIEQGSHDNIFDLPYYDLSKISETAAGYNSWLLDGKMMITTQAGEDNDFGRSTIMHDAAPTVLGWREGDKVWNNSPSDGTLGWVCIASGTPGTWNVIPSTSLSSAIYDFSVSGGAISSIQIGSLPDNAVITRAYYQIITPFTSGGGATVAIEIATDDANGIVTATAFDNAVFNAGYHEAIQTGTMANISTQTTAFRAINFTIAAAALTAGKLKLWWEYVVGE